MREVLIDVMASLDAAISLLERTPKKAAPSDKMFDQMLADYRASLERARASLADPWDQLNRRVEAIENHLWPENEE